MSQALEAPSIACPNCGHQLSPSIDTPSSRLVPELLHSNRSATKQEANLLKAKLDEADAELSRFDCDIAQLQALLASRIQQREHLRRYQVSQRYALSSFGRFPPEVLALIFREVGLPAFRSAYPPSQVCKFWRDVAFSTPSLWTNSFMVELREGKEQQELQWTQRWLSNSGGLPISFTLGNYYAIHTVPSHPCIKLLAAQAHRWMNAQLYLHADTMGDLLSAQNNFPMLENLTIGKRYMDDTPLLDDLADAFASAPRLKSLHLGQRVSDRMIKMPWNQLTTCALDGQYTIVECYDLIKYCQNMMHCELCITHSTFPEIDITQRPLLIHPNIKNLQIVEGVSLRRLLDRLELPALTKYGHSDFNLLEDVSIYDSIVSLFARSMPLLSSLHLDHTEYATDRDLIDCLSQCPLLEELYLTMNSANGVNSAVLRRLTHDSDQLACCLVPKLQNFSVQIESQFNFEAFAKMVESRWRHHGRECRAPDHRPVVRMREATLRLSYDEPGIHAEDAIWDTDGEKPPWLLLLQQIQSEGFNLVPADSDGHKSITLENLVYRIDVLDSD